MDPLAFLGPYRGYLIGAALLGAVLWLNFAIFRARWARYPSLPEYLAAHPGSQGSGGVLCHRCGSKPKSLRVSGRGELRMCPFCERPLYRIDR